jgi:pimeloyl-ACP methyl ester carboxylesterase
LDIHAPLMLVGHSDGASIALIFSSFFPDRVLATVSIAGHVFVEDITVEGIKKAIIDFHSTDMKEKLKKYHGDKTEKLFYSWSNTWLSQPYRDWNIEKYLKSVICPVFVIQGANDEYATLLQVKAIREGINGPGEKWIVPGCGHFPQKEQPEQTIEAIDHFFRKYIVNIQ